MPNTVEGNKIRCHQERVDLTLQILNCTLRYYLTESTLTMYAQCPFLGQFMTRTRFTTNDFCGSSPGDCWYWKTHTDARKYHI
jgi:hypothetical protein